MEEGGVIKEGFICPICHRDLRAPSSLLAHFQDLHSEEQDLLSSLKELVGKAKKKILKGEERDADGPAQTPALERGQAQEVGHVRSHTQFYREARRERLDHRTTETNKLIIRLDRLLGVGAAPAERRQEEQRIVAWLEGATVTRCPSCAATFNIARRQHHCRLCGSIMCNSCSCFLSHAAARAIVAPVHLDNYEPNKEQRSDSENIRICSHCMDMIECRRQVQFHQTVQPAICKLYYELQKLKAELQPSIKLYLKMQESLGSGETTFQLQDAQSLRGSIAKQAEQLDLCSKRIQALPAEPDCPKTLSLQAAVKRATSQYIKEHLLELPGLPAPADLAELRRRRADQRLDSAGDEGAAVRVQRVAVTTGWTPARLPEAPSSTADPLAEQIGIVRNYIQQARQAHRFEEVASLEENLRLLERARRERALDS